MGNKYQISACVTFTMLPRLLFHHKHTLGSNSTVANAIPGPSVAALIVFAALSWGIIVSCTMLSFFSWCLTPNCNDVWETGKQFKEGYVVQF